MLIAPLLCVDTVFFKFRPAHNVQQTTVYGADPETVFYLTRFMGSFVEEESAGVNALS